VLYNVVVKKVAVTMGEPGGIGPEVALRAVAETLEEAEHVLVGDKTVFTECTEMLKASGVALPFEPGAKVKAVDTGGAEGYTRNSPSAAGGRASHLAIERAAEMAMSGEVDAIVTAPVSKEAFRMAGLPWPGHTELLAEFTGTKDFAMMLAGGGLRVILVTIHMAIKDVASHVTEDSVLGTLRLAARASRMLGIDEPRIAVSGLNPHAGERGLFGDEESGIIEPAIEAAREEGIPAVGPFPPDTVFRRAAGGEFDIVVAMYHDQGLIPLKLLGFETGVNITVGLPIIRTSPDHGTAYDIAWKGKAYPGSMVEAVRLALKLRI
jgi:4-hydroxythreonine-4-phosphate dehydrogenase